MVMLFSPRRRTMSRTWVWLPSSCGWLRRTRMRRVVAGFRMTEAVLEFGGVRRKAPLFLGLAVEGNECELPRRAAGDVVEHGGELGVAGKLADSGSADLEQDDDGNGLALGFFNRDALLDSIVEELEVLGGKGVEKIAVGRADERGDDYER
jgi:hypothetical protein